MIEGIGAKLRGAAGPQPDDTSLDRRRSLSPETEHSGTAQKLPDDGDRAKYLVKTHAQRKESIIRV